MMPTLDTGRFAGTLIEKTLGLWCFIAMMIWMMKCCGMSVLKAQYWHGRRHRPEGFVVEPSGLQHPFAVWYASASFASTRSSPPMGPPRSPESQVEWKDIQQRKAWLLVAGGLGWVGLNFKGW